MKALVAAAAALVTLLCGSPALAAQAPEASGAPVGSSYPSMVRTKKTPQVRIVRVSDRRPEVGRRVVVTGRTRAASRGVALQVRRATARGHRWVVVDRARSRKGRFVLATRVRHADVDRVRVVASRTRTTPRSVSRAQKLVVRVPRNQGRPTPRPASPVVPPSSEQQPPAVPEPTGTQGVEAPVEAHEVQAELGRLVRTYRRGNGRTELGGDACLAAWAEGFARAMARTHVFAHSGSPEWGGETRGLGTACPGSTPRTYRQEAIARVSGASAAEVAAAALADLQAAWMHDEVLLDDAGTGRVMEVGAAQDDAGEWFVVVAFAAA